MGFHLGGGDVCRFLQNFTELSMRMILFLGKKKGCRSAKLQGCVRSHYEVLYVRKNEA